MSKLSILAITLGAILATNSSFASDDFEVLMCGPQDKACVEHYRRGGDIERGSIKPSTKPTTASNRSNKENNTESKKDADKPATEPAPMNEGGVECKLADIPVDIVIPKPRVPRINMQEISGTMMTMKGDSILDFITKAKPDNYDGLDDYQILAAVYRLNPDVFDNLGVKPNMLVQLPSKERMLLEDPKTGHEIERAIQIKKINRYQIPDLVLAWAEEDKKIASLIEAKKARDAEVERIYAEYNACVVLNNMQVEKKKNLEDIQSNIDNVTERVSEEVFQREIIDNRTKIEISNQKIDEIEKQVSNAVKEMKHTNSIREEETSSIVATLKDIKDELAKIKATQEELRKKQEEDAAASLEGTLNKTEDNSLYLIIGCSIGGLLLAMLLFFAFMKFKQNKMRKRAFDDEDDNIDILADTEHDILGDLNTTQPLFDNQDSENKDKVDAQEKAETAEQQSKSATQPQVQTHAAPNLESPDESISEKGSESPDLVPTRFSRNKPANDETAKEGLQPKPPKSPASAVNLEQPAGDKAVMDEWALALNGQSDTDSDSSSTDEAMMKEWQQALNSQHADNSKKDDADVMNEWAAALDESKAEPKVEAPSEAPKSDAAVMDEWAAALGEAKEEPKAESPSEAPKSDADVMDEWAAALGEAKEEPKAEAPSEAPKSDADVMNEWAAALGEAKEEPKAEAPKSDADVMNEWAAALGEAKEEPKAEAPKSDEDVMKEWAAALGETK